MPKNLTPAMRAHLDLETTRLAAIWRITRKDGQQFFVTDHDRDIVFAGEVYRADAGFERTAIRSDAGFAVDNLDLVGVFAEGGIVEDDVRAGLFDGAEIAISFVNWDDPDGHGEIRLRRGTLGRDAPRGLSQPLAQSTLEVFSPNCRADLGDQRCKFPIQPPELGRDQAVSEGAFYRVPTAAGTGSAGYEDRIYEVIDAGTTAASQPAYDTTIGAVTTDGTAILWPGVQTQRPPSLVASRRSSSSIRSRRLTRARRRTCRCRSTSRAPRPTTRSSRCTPRSTIPPRSLTSSR
jgi:hypothetical protein